MTDSPQIFVHRRPERQSVDFIIRENDGAFAYGLTSAMPADCEEPPVAVSISDIEAQAFMDRLWYCGFRPSRRFDSANILSVVQNHLEDMRRLVFPDLKES